MTKAVFSRSPTSISTCQYPLARSRLQKNLAKGVEAVLNVREQVGVYLHNLIESSVVDTKPRRSILLFHQDGRTAPRTVALLDNLNSQHVFNEQPFLLPAGRPVVSNSLFNRWLVARVYLVLYDVGPSQIALSCCKQVPACRHGRSQLQALPVGEVWGRLFH